MKRPDMHRLAALSGIGAVLTYIAATVLGGMLRPQYSQVADDVSKLTEAGAPHRRLLAFIYGTYNLLLVVFGRSLYLSSARTRLFRVGWLLTVLNSVSGVLQVTALRRDPDGVPLTGSGKGHVAGAGVSALCTVLQAWVLGFAFRRDPYWRPLVKFSLTTGALIPVSGSLTAISTSRGSKLMGLSERVTIGLSLLWVLVVSGYALRRTPAGASLEEKGNAL